MAAKNLDNARAQKDLDTLRKWHKLAVHSESIEEFEEMIFETFDESEKETGKIV